MRAIRILQRSLSPCLAPIHQKRQQALFSVVEALLGGGRLVASALGRSINTAVAAKHNIKKVDRLLGNHQLHAETTEIFGAIAKLMLRAERPRILIDWTEIGNHQVALAACVPVEGRSVPIYVETHPTEKLSNPIVEMHFLRTLKKRIVPSNCKPVIVADAGFHGPFLSQVQNLGWDFVGRLGAGVLVSDDKRNVGHRGSWVQARSLHARATARPIALGAYTIARSNPYTANLVVYKEKSKGRKGSRSVNRKGVHPSSTSYRKYQRRGKEPWLLTTSLDHASAREVVNCYRNRMTIEETFRDTKSHRFGWSFEDAASKDLARLRVLLLIGALAMLLTVLIGVAAEEQDLHGFYQANTIRNRRVLSFFTLGTYILKKRLAQEFLSHMGPDPFRLLAKNILCYRGSPNAATVVL